MTIERKGHYNGNRQQATGNRQQATGNRQHSNLLTLSKFFVLTALVLSFVSVMGLTAYATPTVTLLTTITATGTEQASYSKANVATVSFSNLPDTSSAYSTKWGWWGYGWSATVNAAEGYTITKCIFYDDSDRTATDSEAPFVVETTEDDKTPKVNGTPILAYQSKGIKKIEVYGYATPAHTHSFTYSASGATITATCGANGCGLTDSKATLTIVKPTLTTYGGTGSASATLTGLSDFSTATGKEIAETAIQYFNATKSGSTYTKSGSALSGAPTGAGDYLAEITLTGVKTSEGDNKSVTASVGYTIAPAAIDSVAVADITAPAATEALDTAATTSTGNVTLGTVTWNPTTTPAAYATQYTATVIATAAANYAFAENAAATVNGQKATVTKNDNGTLSISYAFDKTDLTPVTITTANKTVTYSPSGITIPADGMFTIPQGAGTATYSVTNGTGVGTITNGKLTVTKCGTFTVKVSTDASDTHAAAEASATLTVSPKDVTDPNITVTPDSFIYDGNPHKPTTVTVKDGDTVIPDTEYSVGYENNVNPGDATVTITNNDGGNYTVSGSASFTIAAWDENAKVYGTRLDPVSVSGPNGNGLKQTTIFTEPWANGVIIASVDITISTESEELSAVEGKEFSTAVGVSVDIETNNKYEYKNYTLSLDVSGLPSGVTVGQTLFEGVLQESSGFTLKLVGTPTAAGNATVKIAAEVTVSGALPTLKASAEKTVTMTVSEAIPVESVTLDKTSADIAVDETLTLTATVIPGNTTEDQTVTWTSSKEAVATVENGVVKGITAGTATITATSNANADASATCTVTVSKIKPTITAPTASDITYGETLSKSTLSGGTARAGETTVEGSFAWSDGAIKPAVSDSGKTPYKVIFTPTEAGKYEAADCEVTVVVKAAPEKEPEKVVIGDGANANAKDINDYLDANKDNPETLTTVTEVKIENTANLENLSGIEKLENVETLTINGADKLTDISAVKALDSLENLTISGAGKLTDISAVKELDSLKTLDVSNCASLKTVDVGGCDKLEKLDVSGCDNLQNLNASGTGVKDLDVSQCTQLQSLDVSDGSLNTLNVSGCTKLEKLDCSKNHLLSLDLSGFYDLSFADCHSQDRSGLETAQQSDGTWKVALPDGLATGTVRVAAAGFVTDSVKVYDKNGNLLTATAAGTYASQPTTVKYDYNTGYKDKTSGKDVLMDVTLYDSSVTPNPGNDAPTSDKGSGGCNAGLGLAGIALLCTLPAVMTRKRR